MQRIKESNAVSPAIQANPMTTFLEQIEYSYHTMRLLARLAALSAVLSERHLLNERDSIASYKNSVWQQVSELCHYILTNDVEGLVPIDSETSLLLGIVHGTLHNTVASVIADDNVYLAQHLSSLDMKIKAVIPDVIDKSIIELYESGKL